MLFPTKTDSQILQEMMDDVFGATGLSMTPGGVAKSLLEVFNRRLSAAYRFLDISLSMAFLSAASGLYLDRIGELLNCSRRGPMEEDDNYRFRISKQVFTVAAANRTSIRLKCLSVAGVKDIVMTPYSRGNGSFTIHVISDEVDTPASVLDAVSNAVAETKAEGIRSVVTKPAIVPLDITFNVVLKSGRVTNETSLALQISDSLSDYIDKIPMGGTVSIGEIYNIAVANDNVSQVYIKSILIGGESVMLGGTYQLEWDSRIYVNKIITLRY